MSDQPDSLCFKCELPIMGKQWTSPSGCSQGQVWHVDCFQCSVCSKALNADTDSFSFSKETSSPLCPEHKQHKPPLSVKKKNCHKCKTPTGPDSETVFVKARRYHRKCLECDQCKVHLSFSQWFDHQNKVYCKTCFHLLFPSTCNTCKASVQGQVIITPNLNYWCPQCFKCKACQNSIKTAKYFELLDELYCVNCEMQYRNAKYTLQKMGCGAQETDLTKPLT